MAVVDQDAQRDLMRQYRIQAFISTWCCYAGFYFCRQAFYVVKPNLGFDGPTLARLGAAYLIAYAIGEFNAAAIGSRIGARRLLLTGMAISLACNIVFGFANNQWTFMAFLALNGLAQATGWSGNVGTMAHWFRRQERGQVMGVWSTCYQIGSVVAKWFAAFMLGWLGWRWSFWGTSMVLSGVWLLFYFLQRNKPEDVGLSPIEDELPASNDNPSTGDLGNVTQETKPSGFTPQLILTILMMGTFYFFLKSIRYALWSWGPYLLRFNYGLSDAEAGYYSTCFDILGFLGVLTAGFVSDRIFEGRRTTVALTMMVGLTVATSLLWFVGLQSLTAFIVLMGMIGFMLFGPDSLLTGAGAIDVGSRKYAIAAAGIINGMGSCGAVCQEFVVGYLYEKEDPSTLGPVFAALILSAAISTTLVFLLALRARAGKCNL